MTEYITVQPVLLENYKSNLDDDLERDLEHPTQKHWSVTDSKDFFEEAWLDQTRQASDSGISLEMIRKMRNNQNLFFLAVTHQSVHVYSQTKMIKSFNFSLPRFKGSAQKRRGDDNDESTQQESDDSLINPGLNARNHDSFIRCVFKKNQIQSAYHESLPQYMFMLIYNCDELLNLRKEKKQQQTSGIYAKGSFLKKYLEKLSEEENSIFNKLKILTFEIFSEQFLSVDLLSNVEDNLESYGQMRLFKSFRNLLVVVYYMRPGKSRSFKKRFPSLKLVIKRFDKYNGFLTILDRKLNFSECKVPFYDVLYSYKKGVGRKRFERERGKYSFNESYSSSQSKPE